MLIEPTRSRVQRFVILSVLAKDLAMTWNPDPSPSTGRDDNLNEFESRKC